MGDTSSEKSLEVFDDGRDDAASVRTAYTERTNDSGQNPLQVLQPLDTLAQKVVHQPKNQPSDRRALLKGTQPQRDRSRTPRRTDPIVAPSRAPDRRAGDNKSRTNYTRPPPTPMASGQRNTAERKRPRSRSPSRKTDRRESRHYDRDHDSSCGRDRMPPP